MPIGMVNYEQQYVLRDTSGAIVWQGSGIGGVTYDVTSVEASATIAAGGAVIVDSAGTTVLGRNANNSTTDADVNLVNVLQVASAASVGFLGVASTPIPALKRGTVMGPGTLCTVRTTNGAIALGDHITGSATAGLCAKLTPATTAGVRLGICIKATAQIASTGLYTAGVLIAPN